MAKDSNVKFIINGKITGKKTFIGDKVMSGSKKPKLKEVEKENLQAKFLEEKEKIEKACLEKIQETLKEFGCDLRVQGQFVGSQIQTSVTIVKV